MPTGYTADLYEGKEVTFEEFALRCARAFGVLVTMREEPLDAPIPEEFQPDDWHLKELKKVLERLAEIESWDEEKAEQEAAKAYQKALRDYEETLARKAAIRQRYENMLEKVKRWVPPTPDHIELKNFMIQQLESSIEFDCNNPPDKPQRLSGKEYKNQQLKEVIEDIKYHEREYVEEVKRTKERNEWLRALRESLRQPLSP